VARKGGKKALKKERKITSSLDASPEPSQVDHRLQSRRVLSDQEITKNERPEEKKKKKGTGVFGGRSQPPVETKASTSTRPKRPREEGKM